MARLVPSDIKAAYLGGAHQPELETLVLLRKALPSHYTVYHGVHWSTAFDNTTRYGEIDFVVVHDDGRLVVIEQKNGILEESDDGIFKSYAGGRRKPVGRQLHRSIDAIREKFEQQHPGAGGLFINYLVFCPDYHLVDVHGAGLDRTRVVDAKRKNELGAAITALFDDRQERDLPAARLVHAFFRQTFDVVPDVAAHRETNEEVFTRLSGGLIEIFDQLEFEPRRLKIEGVAGCGKSLLAQHTFQQALDRGLRPLYVCFNRALADRVAGLFEAHSGLIETFHGLCRLAREACDAPVDFSRAQEPGFWDELVDSVAGLAIPESLRFDVVIVDEGQDFRPYWFETLALFLVDDYELLWLEDPNQDILNNGAVDVPATVTYHAQRSYRTPTTIANFIEETLDIPFRSGNHLPGLGVGVYEYEQPHEQLDLARARINELRRIGFDNEDILVLTCASLKRSPFDCVFRPIVTADSERS